MKTVKDTIEYLRNKIQVNEALLRSLEEAFRKWILDDRDDAVIQYNWKDKKFEVAKYSPLSNFMQFPTWDAAIEARERLVLDIEDAREELAALLPRKKRKAAKKIYAEIRFKS